MANEEWTRALLDRLKDHLTPLGYRRQGQTFASDRGDVMVLINLQKSTSSTSDRVRVTINLGACVKRLLDDRHKPTNIWACQWMVRLGEISSARVEKWWAIESADEADGVAHEMTQALDEYGLPALERVSSMEGLLSFWKSDALYGTDLDMRKKLIAELDR
jgi:hypothetical protein